MYKKSLSIALANLITLGGLSSLLTIVTLIPNNQLLTAPAYALPNGGQDRPERVPQPKPQPAPVRNYPAASKFLLSNSSLLQQVVTKSWNEGGKGIAEQKIKEALNGKEIAKGANIYNVNPNLGGISQQQVSVSGNNQVNVTLTIPGNSAEFKSTTPTVFGQYADPSFRVGFDLNVNLKISTDRIHVDDLSVTVSGANFHGSNLTGTLYETIADLFTNGGFSRDIISHINGDYETKGLLDRFIQSAIISLVPSNVINK